MYRYRLLDQEKNASFLSKFVIFFSIPKKIQRSFLMIENYDLWSITKCAKSGLYRLTLSALM